MRRFMVKHPIIGYIGIEIDNVVGLAVFFNFLYGCRGFRGYVSIRGEFTIVNSVTEKRIGNIHN